MLDLPDEGWLIVVDQGALEYRLFYEMFLGLQTFASLYTVDNLDPLEVSLPVV